MSLHKFAEQVAANGRGDDSLLVHMTPDEVQRLQAFAQANGTTLTINPTTGLPEAGLLSNLFKAVAPVALGAFLGPAGAAFGGGLFASAATAGLAVGGITTLATGSLSRGLMAGLGAYGGAGLGESLMNAGTGALSQAAGAGLGEEAAQQAVASKLAAATPVETLTAGYNAATATPSAMGTFAKQNLGNLAYAASPILAGAMVPTTTQAPKSDNYIRQFDFNINPETGKPDPLYGVRAMTPVRADEFGNKTFQGQRDLFRQQNPNPYEFGVASLNQPPQQQTGMAGGGIVALARGGVPRFDGEDGSLVGEGAVGGQSVADLYASIGRTPEKEDLAFWQTHFGKGPVTADQAASFMESANAVKAKEAAAAAPTTLAANTTGGVTNLVPATNVADTTGITALQPQATSPQPSVSPPPAQTSTADAQAAVNNIYRNVLGRDADATGLNFWSNAIANGRSVDSVYQDILASANMVKSAGTLGDFGIKTMTAADATKPYTGFTSTESNTIADEWVRNTLGREPTAADRAQSWYKDVANLGTNTDAAKVYGQFQGYAGTEATKTIADRIKAIDAELKAKNLTDADLLAQTGKTKQQLAAEGFKTGLDFMGASQLAPAASRTKFDLAALKKTLTPQTNAPAGTTTPYGNATNPGDITINPDGSKTITPNIPGRPYGGFRGIQEIKDAYTQGGGSLGYTSPVVQTAEEHEARYNKLTGDSEAAYRYLMGKGANPIKSTAPKIAVPYDEYALGKKTAGLKPATVSGNTLTVGGVSYDLTDPTKPPPADTKGPWQWNVLNKRWIKVAADGTVISDGSGSGGVGGNSGGPSGGSDGAIGTGGMGADGGDGAQSGGGADNARGGLMPHGAYHMAAGGITGNGQLNLNIPLDIGGGGGGGGGGYTPMGGGFSSGGGYQGQGNQNSVQQSGMPDFRDQMAGFDAQIQKLPSVTAYSNYTNSISGRPPTADERAQIDQLRKAVTSDQGFMDLQSQMKNTSNKYQQAAMQSQSSGLQQRYAQQSPNVKTSANSFNDRKSMGFANGGMMGYAVGGGLGSLGSYSDGGRLLKGPGDGVSDSIPATIGAKQQPARLADGEFVIPARIVSELGNGSTDAGAKKLYAMMDRVQRARGKTTGKNKVAANSRSDKYLPA